MEDGAPSASPGLVWRLCAAEAGAGTPEAGPGPPAWPGGHQTPARPRHHHTAAHFWHHWPLARDISDNIETSEAGGHGETLPQLQL